MRCARFTADLLIVFAAISLSQLGLRASQFLFANRIARQTSETSSATLSPPKFFNVSTARFETKFPNPDSRSTSLHAAFSICRTRSSHSRISPILLLVRFTCTLAARRLRAVERSMETRPSLEIRSHFVENFCASLVSSAADFLSRAFSVRMLSCGRVGLGIGSSVARFSQNGTYLPPD